MPAADPQTRELQLKERRSLFWFGFIFTLLALGLAATAIWYYRNYEQQYRQGVATQLSATLELKLSELMNWRAERLGDAALLYRHPTFSALATRYLAASDPQARVELLAWMDKYLKASAEYDQVRLLDPRGVTRLVVPNASAPLSPVLAGRLSEVLETGQVRLVDFYRDAADQRIYLALLIPVFEPSGLRVLGVLALRIDPAVYLYPFIQTWPTPSVSAETLLIRREANEIVYLNELRFQKNSALNLRRPLTGAQAAPVESVLWQTGVVQGVDYRGVPVLAKMRAVPASPWFLAAHIDLAEVYAPVRERLGLVVLFFGGLIISAGAGLLLVWRQQSLRFYQAQTRSAAALRASEQQYRGVVERGNDGIVLLQDERMAYCNPQLAELLGWPAAVLTGAPFLDRVAPADRARVADFHRRRLRGEAAPSRYEINLLHASGELRPVEVSASLTEHQARPAVLAFVRDITENRRVRQALQQAHDTLEQRVLERTSELARASAELERNAVELERRVAERTRALSSLYEVAEITASATDLPRLLARALEKALETLASPAGWLHLLLEDDSGAPDEAPRAWLAAQSGLRADQVEALRAQACAPESWGRVMRDNQTLIVPEARSGLGWFTGAEAPATYIGVPIHAQGQVLGALSALVPAGREFSAQDLALLAALADRIGVAVENAHLRQLAEQAAVVGERRRLARELHDSVTQALYGQMLLTAAGRDALRAGDLAQAENCLSQLGDTAQQTLKDMRLLIYELQPRSLSQTGLAGALRQRLEAVERRVGIQPRLLIEAWAGLPLAVEAGLYRIALEALNNALKHAAASQVTVRVGLGARGPGLEVSDNGRGFDPAAAALQGGQGLSNMRARAEALAGELTIVSDPGGGTRVTVRLAPGGGDDATSHTNPDRG